MQRWTPSPLGLTLAAAMTMAGCQSTAIGGTAQSPSAITSRSTTGSPTATPSQAMTAGFKVSDIQEAEKLYRAFITAYWQVSAHGSSANESEKLLDFTDPPFKSTLEAALKFQREQGITVESGQGNLISARPAINRDTLDSVVALEVCTDERQMIFRRSDGATKRGRVVREIAYFHRSPQGTLRYFANQDIEDTGKCLN